MMARAEGAARQQGALACSGLLAAAPSCLGSPAACEGATLAGSHASASTPMSWEMYLS